MVIEGSIGVGIDATASSFGFEVGAEFVGIAAGGRVGVVAEAEVEFFCERILDAIEVLGESVVVVGVIFDGVGDGIEVGFDFFVIGGIANFGGWENKESGDCRDGDDGHEPSVEKARKFRNEAHLLSNNDENDDKGRDADNNLFDDFEVFGVRQTEGDTDYGTNNHPEIEEADERPDGRVDNREDVLPGFWRFVGSAFSREGKDDMESAEDDDGGDEAGVEWAHVARYGGIVAADDSRDGGGDGAEETAEENVAKNERQNETQSVGLFADVARFFLSGFFWLDVCLGRQVFLHGCLSC